MISSLMRFDGILGVAGLALSVGLLPASQAAAETIVWGGTDGEYTVNTNWEGDTLPDTNAGDTAQIDAGEVTYTAGPDLQIHAGGSLTINGGSWTQVGGVSWIQLTGGSIIVGGGTFDQGTAGNIIRDVDSAITVSAGSASLNGNVVYQPTATGALSITGGVVNVENEFKPVETFTMSAGTLNVGNLISFADGDGGMIFSGGEISVDGSGGNSGFYGGGGTKSLDFTAGSTGVLRFRTYTAAELTADGFLTNGTITLDGATDAAAFSVLEADGDVTVQLNSVPEPGSLALFGLGAALVAVRRR